GPIQNAPSWQEQAIEYLQQFAKDNAVEGIDIASPRLRKKPEDFDYDEQVEWEKHYLEHSGLNGVILFWMAKPEDETKLDPTRAYAQTTRFELAEWFGRAQYIDVCFSIGYEEGFHGIRYITKRFNEDLGEYLHKSLKDTCEHAILSFKPFKG
ncbi:MAG TPA: hypothetical protein P5509_04840, partial [Bacteroidales bacterium]|nr:hypothetical protein [Bacteroidales bacterium]